MKIKTKQLLGNWPALISFLLAAIPLAILLFIVVSLVNESLFAINGLGLGELFQTQFTGIYTRSIVYRFGLLPSMWGTFLVTAIALVIALPASLAMAIFASEFPLGFLGRGIRTVLGLLSGIPPVIYAMMSIFFTATFIMPKFGGADIPQDQLPTYRLPYDGCTLLGGIMLALIIIPFIAPLIDDAIRNVPGDLREASYGLGANRWHTLKKVVIPFAAPGILAAATLGALKAMGDVVIAGWVIAWESGLPNPLWDILEKTAPLTSTAAGMMGVSHPGESSGGYVQSVTYFSGLVLLVVAVAGMALVGILQKKLQKKFSR